MHGNALKSAKNGDFGEIIGTKLAPKMNRHAKLCTKGTGDLAPFWHQNYPCGRTVEIYKTHYIVIFHDNAPRAFIAKLTEIQRTAEQLLAQLQASHHDKFAAHLYRSRREYRSDCDHAGKSGKSIERCLISTFRVAESMGFKGDYRQWEHLLRIGD